MDLQVLSDNKRRINVLWFPQVRYLSLQPYNAIINEAKHKGQNILLDTSAYSNRYQAISEVERQGLLDTYDIVHILVPDKTVYHAEKHLNEYLKFRELKKKILKIIELEEIGVAVFPIDIIYEFRVLRGHVPEVKLIVLQVAFRQMVPYKQIFCYCKIKQFLLNLP